MVDILMTYIGETISPTYDTITGTVDDIPTVFVLDPTSRSYLICYCQHTEDYSHMIDATITYTDDTEPTRIVLPATDIVSQLITDRTDEDVQSALSMSAEQRAYTKDDLKGTFNKSDLDRIWNSIVTLLAYINSPAPTPPSSTGILSPAEVWGGIFGNLAQIYGYITGGGASELTTTGTTASEIDFWNFIEEHLQTSFDVVCTRFKYYGKSVTPLKREITSNFHNMLCTVSDKQYKIPLNSIANLPLLELEGKTLVNTITNLYEKIVNFPDVNKVTEEEYTKLTEDGIVKVKETY